MIQIGIVGTGFVARGAYRILGRTAGFEISKVLTRRRPDDVAGFDPAILTTSLSELIDESDLVFEASGDAVHATEVAWEAIRAGLPLVTMDSEFHVTTGSYFVDKGYITEADGDQPGCLARLRLEAEAIGFTPLAYLNIKGFLNPNPGRAEMEHWARVQHLKLDQVVSFTDGSKLQVEQALVANGLGADLIRDGMVGSVVSDPRAAGDLAAEAERLGRPISDYILSPASPPGVFLVGRHEEIGRHDEYGPFAKVRTTDGRFGVLVRPYHLIHIELPRTVNDVLRGEPPLLNNSSTPRVGVAAVAKAALRRDQALPRALGSFEVRGEAVTIADDPDHVPICLLDRAILRRAIEPGQRIRFDDVELPESRALEIYGELRRRAIRGVDAPEELVA